MNKTSKYISLLTLLAVIFTACKKQWDQRDKITDQQLNVTVMQQLKANPDLSVFASYVTQAGYDTLLNSTKTYTVWAPNNAAMQAVDQSLINDKPRLRLFVANHIANQVYLTNEPQPSMRIHNLLGKNVTFTSTTVEEANIVKANQYVKNGVVHTIDKALNVKQSIWEYINSLTGVAQENKKYLTDQNYTITDTAAATVSGIDPVTGKPILVAGTGLVHKNHYFDNVADLSNEDSLYTHIILTDAAFDQEQNMVSKYFTTSTVDSTYSLSAFNIVKDLTVKGVVKPDQLPDHLVSVNNVNVPINKAAIVQTYNASNGIIYVMSSVNFNLADKITPIYIQGENPSYFSRTDKGGDIFFRVKKDPQGTIFNDIFISGSGASGALPAKFFAAYNLNKLYSCQYTVYWRAVNDLQTTAISQQLSFGSLTTPTFPYTSVPPNVYTETQLGTYTMTRYGYMSMFLIGANSTAAGTNSLTLDYVKLVPVLQ